MKPIRAVIFDVYKTLLEVLPAPSDAAVQWEQLWRTSLDAAPRLDLPGFARACDVIIAREHAAARQRGIPFPEIYWPAVAAEVLPELHDLPSVQRDEFLFRQSQLWHTVRLMRGAAEVLREARARGYLLGVASNAQPYTWRELDLTLRAVGLDQAIFDPRLCFWSFEHGFSKPDPHVFQILAVRLLSIGLKPDEVLMVGDREDNDILPARNMGWQTWRLSLDGNADGGGNWDALRQALAAAGGNPPRVGRD